LQKELRRAYERKLVTLWVPTGQDIAHYDSQGQPTRPGSGEPWTTCGLFVVRRASIKAGQIDLDGQRQIVTLNTGGYRTRLVLLPVDREIHVTVDLPRSVQQAAQLHEFLAKVFVSGDFDARLAEVWHSDLDLSGELDDLAKNAPGGQVGVLAGDRPVYLVKPDSVTKPTAIYRPGPKYSEKALFKHVSGTVRVRLVVNEKGFPEILEATEHLGEGLDMHALSSVAQWRFEPARKNGQPVAVMVVVEINFRIRRRGERSTP
jgi:TonB family protein